MPAFLRVVHGDAPLGRFELFEERPNVIGRGDGCDVRIDSTALSRQHCKVEFREDGWHLVDLDSTNGTRMDGLRVTDTLIEFGEHIQVGRLHFEFAPGTLSRIPKVTARPPFPLAGRHFSRFEVLRKVHVGRSGVVYHARDAQKDREIALKLLSSVITADQDALRRFERGIHSIAPVHHPAVLRLYAVGQHEDQWWLAMEWVDGQSVRERLLSQRKLSVDMAVSIARDVAAALDAAASAHIVHRNVKPSSILLTSAGTAKLGNFILTRGTQLEQVEQITQAGEVVGDVLYSAPECLQGVRDIDGRADIYSLGVCLYHMLVGQAPHDDVNTVRAMARIINETPVPLHHLVPEVPDAVERIVLKCLCKERSDRYQSARELLDALAVMSLTSVPAESSAPRSRRDHSTEIQPGANENDVAPPADKLATTIAEVPAGVAAPGTDRQPDRTPSESKPVDAPAVVTAPEPNTGASEPKRLPIGGQAAPTADAIDLGLHQPTQERFWHNVLEPASPAGPKKPPVIKITAAIVAVLVTIVVVAQIGPMKLLRQMQSLVTFRKSTVAAKPAETKPAATGGAAPQASTKSSMPVARKPPGKNAPTKFLLKPTSGDANRIVVEPGSPFRNIDDALEAAEDGTVIEVALDGPIKSEIRIAHKSVTLLAAPRAHPSFANTVRIEAGGTVRFEGFHFELLDADKPAILVESMPEKLELVGCSFRDTHDGVMIALNRPAEPPAAAPQLDIDRCFAAGYIVLGVQDWLPDVRIANSCLVADLAVLDWQLSPDGTKPSAKVGLLLRQNTLIGRSILSIRLADQKEVIAEFPQTTVRLMANAISFPTQNPGVFFRWEAWQKPAIPLDRIAWEGERNAFFGDGEWSLAETLALDDASAKPMVFLDTPESWRTKWAKKMTKPPAGEFKFAMELKAVADAKPSDFAVEPTGDDTNKDQAEPIGADVSGLRAPPNR